MSNTNGMTIIEDSESSLGSMIARSGTMSTAIQAMAAMADMRVSTARLYPRSIAVFKKEAGELLREDVETARSAEYAKPVGGGTVKGPSVRLAELAAMCWGNLEVEVSEPVIGDKSVFVKATAWDLQRNYRQDGTASTSILKKDGTRYQASMIETACAATAGKAKRNAIMAVIPRAYITDLLQIAKEVASGAEKPLGQRRQDSLDYFARTYRVAAEQVFALLGVDGIESITGDHLDELRAVVTGLKDGDVKLEDLFATKSESKSAAILDKLKERQAGSTKPADADKPKDTTSDALQVALDAFHAAGGDPEAMAAANNTTVAKMLSSKGKARDINVELVKTETDMLLLKGKTAVPKDGKLFDETTGVTK